MSWRRRSQGEEIMPEREREREQSAGEAIPSNATSREERERGVREHGAERKREEREYGGRDLLARPHLCRSSWLGASDDVAGEEKGERESGNGK
ncbi:hypothetical protein TIFTF001_032743 [Ficus carica]|uniref:Uncharacterized protein n=1 Tax=Ficus carica TaxID=3494 RepID=A0AA88DXW1_FICCA|nr:hypothetical protein TIFTF001_032660 [Ficus carica]GMN63648.1 hypothetical protein TIFTF001_032743 [Ficus carica]